MGYCPFPALGHDPEIVSRQAGPGARVRARRPCARPSVREQQSSCARSRVHDKVLVRGDMVLVPVRHGPGISSVLDTIHRQCS